jgi:hypothetical protein
LKLSDASNSEFYIEYKITGAGLSLSRENLVPLNLLNSHVMKVSGETFLATLNLRPVLKGPNACVLIAHDVEICSFSINPGTNVLDIFIKEIRNLYACCNLYLIFSK